MKKILCVAMVILLYGGCACADVAINAANFPDANFRKIVVTYDTNKDGVLSSTEAERVTRLEVNDPDPIDEITSLKGIEYFTALTYLGCSNNRLTALDVSKNTALTYLRCSNNMLTALDISKNTALNYLNCHSTHLTALDVSKNTALTTLICMGNMLTALDISKNTALTTLNCSSNQLTALDASKNTALTSLICSSNQLTALDVSKNTKLTYLTCDNNQLTVLDVSKNTALTKLDCHHQTISPLKISSTGDSSYPYQLKLSDYMTSAQIANVSDVLGYNTSGVSIGTTYTDGIAKFNQIPANVVYNYATGYKSQKMGVTITGDAPVEDTKPEITTSSLPDGTTNTAYTQTLTATGTTPITWTISTGTLPTGLTLAADGTISGTPTARGTYSFTVKAANSAGNDTQALKITINHPADWSKPKITTASLPDGVISEDYSQTLTAEGTAPITWTRSAGKLPAGFTLSTDGKISGTPTATGSYSFTAKAQNPVGYTTKSFTLKIGYPADWSKPKITTASLPDGVISEDYSQTLTAEGTAPITWTRSAGKLPAGFTIDADGKISGTPTKTGSYSFTVKAQNFMGAATKRFTLKIDYPADWSKPEITTESLPDGVISEDYSQTLTAEGTAPITWTRSAGKLPAGFTIDADGKISGTPTKTGSYSFTVKAQNFMGTATKRFTLKINYPSEWSKPKITTTALDTAKKGEEYSFQLEAEGTPAPEWRKISAKLPAGLTMTDDGKISGTPAKYGNFTLTARAENLLGYDQKAFKLAILNPPKITTETLKAANVGKTYSQTINAEGTAPLEWSLDGDLPEGLTFTNGTIRGKAAQNGTFTFTAKASNPAGEDSKTLSIDVHAVAPVIGTTLLPAGTWGKNYSAKIDIKKGTPPVTVSVSGNIPEGLAFDSDTLILSGVPQATCKDEILTFTAANMEGSHTKELKLTVNGVRPKIKTSSLADAQKGTEYTAQIEAEGNSPITWSSANLPSWLSIDSETGEISGTPDEEGTFSFKVTAENSNGKVNRSFSVKVTAPPEIISETLPDATAETSYRYNISYNGTKPVKFSVTGGELPKGLKVNAVQGRIMGTPTEAGEFSFTVAIENAAGTSETNFTLTVAPALPRIEGDFARGKTFVDYSWGFTINEASLPVTWSYEGDLPAGLEFDTSTGIFSGVPEEEYTGYITVKAENAKGSAERKSRLIIRYQAPATTADNTLPERGLTPDDKSVLSGDAKTEESSGKIYIAPSEGLSGINISDSLMIAAVLGEVSCDMAGMYDIPAEISGDVPIGAELVYISNSDMPSSDDNIAEFFDEEGNEISRVPESRKIILSVWLEPERIYKPVIAVKR